MCNTVFEIFAKSVLKCVPVWLIFAKGSRQFAPFVCKLPRITHQPLKYHPLVCKTARITHQPRLRTGTPSRGTRLASFQLARSDPSIAIFVLATLELAINGHLPAPRGRGWPRPLEGVPAPPALPPSTTVRIYIRCPRQGCSPRRVGPSLRSAASLAASETIGGRFFRRVGRGRDGQVSNLASGLRNWLRQNRTWRTLPVAA